MEAINFCLIPGFRGAIYMPEKKETTVFCIHLLGQVISDN